MLFGIVYEEKSVVYAPFLRLHSGGLGMENSEVFKSVLVFCWVREGRKEGIEPSTGDPQSPVLPLHHMRQ